MSYRSGVVTGVLTTLLVIGGVVGAWWLLTVPPTDSTKAASPTPPAAVAKPLKEDQINTITLTPEAVERLALRTAAVERKPFHRVRVYGGEVTTPVGRSVLIAAPISGTLKAPTEQALQPGQSVKKGQVLFELLPLLTPEGRANLAAMKIDADGQVKSAQTQLDAARIVLERAQRVYQSEAGSRKAVDEAQAQFDLAHKALESASARNELLGKVAGEVERGTAAPLLIECPEAGMLRNVAAFAGQTVPAGATLFEVVNLDRVWLRVPVYVGDLKEVEPEAEASVEDIAGASRAQSGSGLPAAPVAAPPSANSAAGTVDLYYALDNRQTKLRPGQRVAVALKLKAEAQSLAVPWSAVIHDIHGGTWVYEQTGERVFVRRRVTVRHVIGDTAVLAAGPTPGVKVVSAGAAELFGTETGFTK